MQMRRVRIFPWVLAAAVWASVLIAGPSPAVTDGGADESKIAALKKEKPDAAADVNVPRSDSRKVSFETTEGTWMSLDVSPDGRTICFDLLGDIYQMPIGGGEARAVTRGPAWDMHPRYSPDGKTIAFTSDRGGMENLWLMDADGANPRALTEEKNAYVRSAAWTPDGNFLVARKEDAKRGGIPPVELWMFHRHGGGGIKVTSSDEINSAAGPVVSPDGKYIYFSTREKHFNYTPDLSHGLWQIWRLDRETGEKIPLTGGVGGGARPAISPNGKTLVYVSRRDAESILVARDLASGAQATLAAGVTRDEQEGFTATDLWPAYAFTPDGKSLVFSDHGKIVRLDLASRRIAQIPFKVKVELSVAPRVAFQDRIDEGPVRARILRWPGETGNGRRIAFEALGRIWIQEVRNGKADGPAHRLTVDFPTLPPREYAPRFSPDGKWIAFVSWSDAGGGHLWKAGTSGGGVAAAPVRLTRSPGHYSNPSWSPDGKKLAFIRGSGLEFRGRQPEEEEAFEIQWVDSTGGESHDVTSVKLANAMKFHPQAFWNRDGSRIFYRFPIEPAKPTDDPKNDLVSVRLDGTDRKAHLRFPPVDDLVPSPDGEWVAFSSRDNVYVAALPSIQLKETPEVSLKEGAVPVWRLSEDAGGYVGWDGNIMTWALGNEFHRLPVADAIRFVEEEKRKADAKKKKEGEDKKEEKGDKDKEKDKPDVSVPKSETIELQLTAVRPKPAGSVVFENARVISMKGDEILGEADLVVTGNRIAAVGAHGKVAIPSGANRIAAAGKTIIPGLIDTHAHLHYSGFELFPETKWEYVANLAYGVTTVYDPSAPSLDVFAQAEMVEAGKMLGPRVFSSGDVLYGGQQEDVFAEVNDQEGARRQVRRMKAYGARMIKVYQQPRRDQRLWFAEACREMHMLLTAEGAGEYHTDLTMAFDGFTAFEHSLPFDLHRDAIELLAKSGTYYTPTLLVSYGGPWGELYYWQTRNPHGDPKLNRFVPHFSIDTLARRHPWISPDEYHFPTVARGAAEVVRAGGNVSLGAHGQLQGLGPHWEIWAMAGEGSGNPAGSGKGGMTAMEAIRASTIAAADKIGLAQDLGSLEPGKLADFVVLDADPLADIHNTTNIRWVVKNGAVYEAETMNEVWPGKKNLPQFFWQNPERSFLGEGPIP